MNKYIVEPITVKMPSGNTAPGGNRVTTRIVPKQGQNIIAGNFTINKQRGYAIGLPGFVRHNSITFFGNTFWFFAPSARLENVTASDADGEMKQELQFKLTGQDDEELEIVCI